MKIAICQPTYLPWIGYFDLIDQVDVFVLLDDVQFEKQSWQQRNRIKTPLGLQWLTVPVMFRGRLEQKIKDVEIRDHEFWRNHRRAIELNYRRARFFDDYFEPLASILSSNCSSLNDLNIALIGWFAGMLGIGTRVLRSSEVQHEGKRTESLANLCRILGATEYLSPLGSAAYLLAEQAVMTQEGINVLFHNYDHPQYHQLFPPFVSHASVIDLLFNEGPASLEIIRSGRRQPLLPAQLAAQVLENVSAQ